jgi:hypothetical protein
MVTVSKVNPIEILMERLLDLLHAQNPPAPSQRQDRQRIALSKPASLRPPGFLLFAGDRERLSEPVHFRQSRLPARYGTSGSAGLLNYYWQHNTVCHHDRLSVFR